MSDNESGKRGGWVKPMITWGNFLSPAITIATIGIPALIWGGRIDSRVEMLTGDLSRNLVAIRTEMEAMRTTTNTMSTTMVMMNTTMNEGVKTSVAEVVRRVVNLESKVDDLSKENNALRIELATLKRSSR